MAKTISMDGQVKQTAEETKVEGSSKYEPGTYKLLDEEVKSIKDLNQAFSNAKMQIGDLELKKQEIIRHIDSITYAFKEKERALVAKYGVDAEINIGNGTVTVK